MKSRSQVWESDVFMTKLWTHLASDFVSCMPAVKLTTGRVGALLNSGDLNAFRKFAWPSAFQSEPALFKRLVQLENLTKRYRFRNDPYSLADLEQLTNDKFEATQIRLATHVINQGGYLRDVVRIARRICRELLGEYSSEEHMGCCRFGRRATVGCSLRESYLDMKLDRPLSGSLDHIGWFRDTYLPTDSLLSEVVRQRSKEPTYAVCDALSLTNVPKSWKTLRSIMPNTTIGSFYTYGLGEMLTHRLEDGGLNLRKLQKRHREIAKQASVNRVLATADLSSASDSITWPLLAMLLPRKWLNAIDFGRIRHVVMAGRRLQMVSVMGMGIGFTFPLQTLVFYSLLKAIAELAHVNGLISVYGDDLIYPRKMHGIVSRVFPRLGFILNSDKTYTVHHFRESCGGDFFHGVDVRPFQPEGQARGLKRIEYLALLYKTFNGLLQRWDRSEITCTYEWLLREVLRVTDRIYQVPPDYPDYSGIKVAQPTSEWHIPWSKVQYSKTGCCFSFRALKEEADRRIVPKLISYYWDKLRASANGEEWTEAEDSWRQAHTKSAPPDKMQIPRWKRCNPPPPWGSEVFTFVHGSTELKPNRPILQWIKSVPPSVVRSKVTGLRLRKQLATVALKGSTRFVSETAHTSVWTVGCK